MYILENIKFNKIIAIVSFFSILLLSLNANDRAVDGGVKYKIKNGMYTLYHVNTQKIKDFKYGRTPTDREIAAWNIDVRPDGEGAPMYDMKHGKVVLDSNGNKKIAEGSVEWGNELYDAQCVMCHGDFGSGGKGYPTLSGGDIESLTNQLQNPADEVPTEEPPRRAIGSYWPYASTLFWYIQDAMPFNHPKSLSNSETYALTAYLLMENGITIDGEELDEEFVMNKKQFLKVKMPNENGFYPKVDTPENPKQGVENITNFLGKPSNYGTGTRCMKDCIKGTVPVLRIKNELNNFTPALSMVRSLPIVKENNDSIHPGFSGYETSCSGCHSNVAIGAPVVGDKEIWAEVMAKGLDKVYHNAINGINGMPPKGGNMELSDKDMKIIIDYMIKSSK